jgi:hypothetical protein
MSVREGNSVVRVLAVNGAFQAEATSYSSYDKPHVTFKTRGNCITIVILSVAKQMNTLKLINNPMTRIFFFFFFFICLGLGPVGS